MTTRDLILACGAAAAIVCAPALAQQNTQPTTPRQDGAVRQPADTRSTTPGTADRNRSSSAVMASPALFNQLAGVWKVDVTCNEKFYSTQEKMRDGMHDKKLHDKMMHDGKTPGEKPNEPMSDQPGQDPVDPANRDAVRRDGTKHDGTKHDGMMVGKTKTYSGYAERKLILGEQVLQETAVVPDMMMDDRTTRPVTNPNDRAPTPDMAGRDAFRAMSFISFDAPSNSYKLVCMDSRKGEIHSSIGTLDSGQNKIVFHSDSKGDMNSVAHRTVDGTSTPTPPNTQPGTKSDPADFSRQPARDKDTLGTGGWHDEHGFHTVLEIMGNDQHQITVYQVNSAVMHTDGTHKDAWDKDRVNKDGTHKDAWDKDRVNKDGTHNTALLSHDSVVYRAVYTRASGAEATRFQRLINDEHAVTRANTDR